MESSKDRVLTEHGPVARGLRRFKIAVGVALVVLALGNGIVLKLVQDQSHRVCVERNERAMSAGKVLAKLAEASRKDGDPQAAAVWREYLEATQKAPIPKC